MTWNPDYATAAELLSYLRVNAAVDTENTSTFAALWVTAVSRNIDDHTGRQFGQFAGSTALTYASVWDPHLCRYVYEIDDLQSSVGLAVTTAALATVTDTDALWPRNAFVKGRPFTQYRSASAGPLTFTSDKWGWAAVPSSIKTGLFLHAARVAARRDSPFGISGSPQEQGEVRLLAQLDPDFKTILKPYVRRWWAR